MTAAGRNVLSMLLLIVEAVVATAVTFGIIWTLTQAATYFDRQPVQPDAAGIIVLRPFEADVTSQVQFAPMAKENQTGDFAYHYGRELLAERQQREVTMRHAGDEASWTFRVARTGRYDVCVSATVTDGSADWQVEIRIDDQVLRGRHQTGAGPQTESKDYSGEVTLADEPIHLLRFTVAESAQDMPITVRRIEIRPVAVHEEEAAETRGTANKHQ